MNALCHLLAELTVIGGVVLIVWVTPAVMPEQLPVRSWDDDLMNASCCGDERLFDAAIAGGADIRAGDASGTTALHYAAFSGNTHLAERLLGMGADPNARNDAGITPIVEAVMGEHTAMVALLLRNGALADDDALNAAGHASAQGSLRLLQNHRARSPGTTGGRHVQTDSLSDRQQ